jgi:lysophospholipase L1-like esterase
MHKRRRLLMAAATAVALAAAGLIGQFAGTANAESNGGTKVMPLGDSITDGFTTPGGYRVGLWQRFVAGNYTVDFVGSLSNGPSTLGDHDHEGLIGWRIDQLDADVVGWLQTYTPHTVLLHIGTNDVIQNDDLTNAPSRLSTLLDHIIATVPTAEIFVATIIPLSDATEEANAETFNAAIPGVVQTKVNAGAHVHLVDMHSALTTADLTDGIHPTEAGYDKMAAVWYKALLTVPGSIGSPGTASPSPTSSPSPSPSPTSSPSASPSPSPTKSSSPSPTPTSTGGAKSCAAAYSIVGSWPGGFQGQVTVTAGPAAISGWKVSWTYANGQTVTSYWSATVTSSGSAVTATNVSYNGALGAGAGTQFGFLGSWTGTNSVPTVSCTAS